MRVLIDTNVLISFLIQPGSQRAVGSVIRAALDGRFILLTPAALLDELTVTIHNRPHLARRIPLDDLDVFVALLAQAGERVPKIEDPFPAATRDRNDDYLLAYALVGRADYLVTGDKDLLTLAGQVSGLKILTPAHFADLLTED